MDCPMCRRRARNYLNHPAVIDMYRCSACELIFGDPGEYTPEENYVRPEGDDLTEADSEAFSRVFSEGIDTSDAEGNMYSEWAISTAKMARGLGDRVEASISRHSSLNHHSEFRHLDVGCATGFLMAEIARRYPRVASQGIEPSPVSCQKARELYGLNVHEGTLSTYRGDAGSFDLITIIGNLQLHADPFESLRRAYELLKPGGLLIFDMKNPGSSARRLARAATFVPVVRDLGVVQLALERSFFCMRYAGTKQQVADWACGVGFEIVEVLTLPPRVLSYSAGAQHSTGVTGAAWRALDGIDRVVDQQAWIQISAVTR